MSKSLIATIIALPGIILTWWVMGILEDAEQQVAVTTVSAVDPSSGALLQVGFTILGIVAVISFIFTLLAKAGIR